MAGPLTQLMGEYMAEFDLNPYEAWESWMAGDVVEPDDIFEEDI